MPRDATGKSIHQGDHVVFVRTKGQAGLSVFGRVIEFSDKMVKIRCQTLARNDRDLHVYARSLIIVPPGSAEYAAERP